MAKQDIFREAMEEVTPELQEVVEELKEMVGGGKSDREQVAEIIKKKVFGQ